MKKKQKIILYRIIITAVMLVVLQFLPITAFHALSRTSPPISSSATIF